ncbi:MAG: HAD family hydrolase [Prevotella sp.]
MDNGFALSRFDTFIFDLDGTLLNSLQDLAISTNWALRKNGFACHPADRIRMFVGNGVRRLVERALPPDVDDATFQRVFDDFKQHYLVHSLDNTLPYDGILPLLHALTRRQKHIAVASNKLQAGVTLLNRRFFSEYIPLAIGESAEMPKKPAPQMLLHAADHFHTPLDRCLYIGDSDVDIATARNCGITCLSVLWGFRDRDFLLKHGATHFVSTPSEMTAQL